jgi:multiple sugar transport system ATP-binding protein
VVQQIGKPLDVYEKPANRFVAGFFGSPSMNFFSGQVRSEQGRLLFANKGFSVELPVRLVRSPADPERRELILGIRPEHVTLGAQSDRDAPTISATVKFVENLGNRLNVYLSSDAGERFVATTASCMPIAAGEKVRLSLDLGKAHLFEPGPLGRNVSILPGTSRS